MRDRPRAHTHARTRAARKWKTSMHEDGVDARVRGITPLASRVSFFFVLLEFILIVRFWGGLSSYFSFFEDVGWLIGS